MGCCCPSYEVFWRMLLFTQFSSFGLLCRFLSQISVNAYKEYLCHTELEQSQAGDKPTALNIQSTVSESRQRERTALSRSCLLHCILGCLLIPNKYIHFSVSLSTRSAISFTNKTAMYLFLVNKFDTWYTLWRLNGWYSLT